MSFFVIFCGPNKVNVMNLTISQESIVKTHCPKDYRCMAGNSDCKVVGKLVSGVLLTYCSGKNYCKYYQPVKGIEGFCWCPVRVELFDIYKR